jgi:glucose uptake protein GlcU
MAAATSADLFKKSLLVLIVSDLGLTVYEATPRIFPAPEVNKNNIKFISSKG